MFEACHAVLALEAEYGREALDENSRTIFHIYRFLSEYEIGGLAGYLHSISPAWNDLVELCEIVVGAGYAELAHALGQVHAIAVQGPVDQIGNWDEWLALADPEGELARLDETISEGYDLLRHELEDLTSGEDDDEEPMEEEDGTTEEEDDGSEEEE